MQPLDPRKVRDVEGELRACLEFIRELPIPEARDFERGRERRRLRLDVLTQILAGRKSS